MKFSFVIYHEVYEGSYVLNYYLTRQSAGMSAVVGRQLPVLAGPGNCRPIGLAR
jgi:hypothetical protein